MRLNIDSNILNCAIKYMGKLKNTNCGIQIIAAPGAQTVLHRSNWFTAVTVDVNTNAEDFGMVEIPWDLKNTLSSLEGRLSITDNSISSKDKSVMYTTYAFPDVVATGSDKELVMEIKESELYRLLNICYSIATDDARPALMGVYFSKNETCALDGYRLAIRSGNHFVTEPFILNRDTAEYLRSILDKNSSRTIIVAKSKTHILFKLNNGAIEVTGSLIQEEFLNYSSLVPKVTIHACNILADELLAELKPSKSKLGILKICFNDGSLEYRRGIVKSVYDEQLSQNATFENKTAADLKYKEKLEAYKAAKLKAERMKKPFTKERPKEPNVKPAKVYRDQVMSTVSGKVACDFKGEFKIHVKAKYLLDALEQYKGDVEIRMTSSVAPIVITQDGYNLDLILPVRMVE